MIDRLVLTTTDEAACIRFYADVLGTQIETSVGGTSPVVT